MQFVENVAAAGCCNKNWIEQRKYLEIETMTDWLFDTFV